MLSKVFIVMHMPLTTNAPNMKQSISNLCRYQIVPAAVCINGLTVTLLVAVGSRGIYRPNALAFPHYQTFA